MSSTKPKVHWFAPALMVTSLLVGLILAVGHHLFYSHLAGTSIPDGGYLIVGSHISRQQLNIAVGTALAFLVKAALLVAVGTAYTQAFWRALTRAPDGMKLKQLDTTYQALSNILAMGKLTTWWRFPGMFLLAGIAWIIPIASIITPATLSVVTAAVSPAPVDMMSVPQFDFTSLNYVSALYSVGAPYDQYCYSGPSSIVTQTSSVVSATGAILPLQPPGPNTSWSLAFYGPSLECNSVESPARDQFWSNIWDFFSDDDNCEFSYGYLSWVPTANSTFPFVNTSSTAFPVNGSGYSPTPAMQWVSSTFVGPFSASPSDPLPVTLYIATLPNMFTTVQMLSHVVPGACEMIRSTTNTGGYDPSALTPTSGSGWFFGNSTLLQCQVRNSTYNADFSYVNGVQDIKIRTIDENTTPNPVSAVQCVTGPVLEESTTATGGGLSLSGSLDCATLNLDGKQCVFDASVARSLSYQGITEAFNRLVLGSIGLGGAAMAVNSSILGTVLAQSSDLEFVANWESTLSILPPLQDITGRANASVPEYIGLSKTGTPGTRGPLQQELEMLFRNVTFSLLGQELLAPSPLSPFSPSPQTEVTSTTYTTIYLYSRKTLWVAYALAIILAFLAVIFGLTSTAINGVSYSANFSSILRVARTAAISSEISPHDAAGSDPLPKDLAGARVKIRRGGYAGRQDSSEGQHGHWNKDKEPAVTESMLGSN